MVNGLEIRAPSLFLSSVKQRQRLELKVRILIKTFIFDVILSDKWIMMVDRG